MVTLRKQVREIQARFQQFSLEATARTALLEEQAIHARKLVIGTQITLLFLLLGICLFVGVQMRTVRSQLVMQRPAMIQTIRQFEGKVEPNLKRFAAQLQAYAAVHPEFEPIIESHRAALSSYFSTLKPVLDVPLQPIPTNRPPPAP